MCGIAGIVARASAPPVDRHELLAIRDAMAARGPDGWGAWESVDGRCGLAHRRLAIIDLSENAAQPMSSSDGRFHITFNGEIYNYRQLRVDLEVGGWRFRSESDTEVLLALYARNGTDMVRTLRGMFAFGIWDARDKVLFLARDGFGIKPLYYSDDGQTVRFASQVKALLAGGGIATTPDPAGHVGFFVMGSVPEPFTMYREIRALPAGTTLTMSCDKPTRLDKFFDVAAEFASVEPTEPADLIERNERLTSLLRDSVRHHMVADVPVGVFLSSGLDSSAVAALARDVTDSDVRSITLGFEEYRETANDEVPLAAMTAAALGTSHVTRWTSRQEFDAEIDRVLTSMDQPSIDGVNTYFVSKAAAERGMKVALSGLGGDELFGGYPSFAHVPRIARTFGWARKVPWVGRAVRRISAPLLRPFASPKYASLLEYGGDYAGAYLLRRALYMPWEVRGLMDPDAFAEGWERLDLLGSMRKSMTAIEGARARVSALELTWYMRNQLLRDADWAGMSHSLEIRVPFVDVHLFRGLAPMLKESRPPTKLDVARCAAARLPAPLLSRPKTGFSIPVHEWARRARIARGPQRQLRNWAHIVHRPYKKLRALVLLTDAFGGHGGIALYNRDFITSLCAMEEVKEVVALPRLITGPRQPLPAKLSYLAQAANSKLRYVWTAVRLLHGDNRFDVVFCCHLNLLLPAVAAKWRTGSPLLMFIYGIDAWKPVSALKRTLIGRIDRVVSISDVTRSKFAAWSSVGRDRITLLPNAIHTDWYGPGLRNSALVERYGLEGKRVLMTVGRLVSSERYKGFDEVINVLPALLEDVPNLVYMVVGDGSDRGRLEDKVTRLGLKQHVLFTGLIPESEKADHYRLADAYVMPSRGEGFGFVLLEAMACGVPAVASVADGTREAVRGGRLGVLVDPDDPEDVRRGILEALQRGRGAPPDGLDFFAFPNFQARARSLVIDAMQPRTRTHT